MKSINVDRQPSGLEHYATFEDSIGDSPKSTLILANMARRLTVDTIHRCGEGHYGGSLSAIDLMTVLHARFFERGRGDRFVLSKGHGAPGYYAVLAAMEVLPVGKLACFATYGAPLQGHPDMTTEPAVDFSTGSLGQGLSAALGMALILKPHEARAWALLGDGECQEGQVWEAAMLAARLGANNLVALIDANGHQECGFRLHGRARPPVCDLVDKWTAFGWETIEVDGHDHASITNGLRRLATKAQKPGALVARTKKGFGAEIFESSPDRFHCDALTATEYVSVLEQLS